MSSPNTMHIRPRTTRPRGICKYYTTPRGCFAGSTCKFLHCDPEQQDSEDSQPPLSPYDQSKRCKYYANGFCRRGDQCWFKHVVDGPQKSPGVAVAYSEDAQNEPCSICFEKPVTYGLLSGCSHIFCITCIRQWRDQKGEVEHGNIKKCPMCREPSRFITPSSRFWKHGHPERERVTNAYKESMAKVPCRYFQRSLQKNKAQPLCPFGKDCFYQHVVDDGTPHAFKHGADISMRQYYIAMQSHRRPQFDDFLDFAADFVPVSVNSDGSGIFSMQITADIDGSTNFDSNSSRTNIPFEDARIRRQLSLLREAMESAVAASNDAVTRASRTLDMARLQLVEITDTLPNGPDLIPSANSPNRGSVYPDGEWRRRHSDDDLPTLQSISNSSVSSDSENESDDDVSRLGRYLRGTGNNGFWTRPEGEENGEEMRMMQEIAERGPEEIVGGPPTLDAVSDEPQIPLMDYETPAPDEYDDRGDGGRVINPPFVTDGRGRVVWSGEGEDGEVIDTEPLPPAATAEEGSPLSPILPTMEGLRPKQSNGVAGDGWGRIVSVEQSACADEETKADDENGRPKTQLD